MGAGTNKPALFELYIGGQLVDRQDANYMVQVWNKFLVDSGAKTAAALSPQFLISQRLICFLVSSCLFTSFSVMNTLIYQLSHCNIMKLRYA